MKKLGRVLSAYTMHNMRAAIAFHNHMKDLGPAPIKSDDWITPVEKQLGGPGWGMVGNDQYGDCTCADCSHEKMLWTANTGTIVVPSTQDTLALYTLITGFNPNDPNTDQGAMINAVCSFLVKTGYLGTKLLAYAPIDPKQIEHIKWAIQLFGTVKIGVQLPDSAMDQFDKNQPWSVVKGSAIDGGHDVCLVGYSPDSNGNVLFDCVTWGRVQPITQDFFTTYCDEVEVPLSPEWISKASGLAPNKLNLAQLQADLATVSA